MAYNYVKFQRGTEQAFNNLINKDPNTLYFIYKDKNDLYGSLYLGDKLISGGGSAFVSPALKDLSDVNLSSLSDGQILVYNAVTQKWNNLDLNVNISQLKTRVNNLENIIGTPAVGDLEATGLYQLIGTKADKIDIINLSGQVGDLNNQINIVSNSLTELQGLVGSLDFSVINSLSAAIGDLTQLYNYNEENNNSLVENINILNERLQWTDINT